MLSRYCTFLVELNDYVLNEENLPFTSTNWIWHTEIPVELYASSTNLVSYQTGVFYTPLGRSLISDEGYSLIDKQKTIDIILSSFYAGFVDDI